MLEGKYKNADFLRIRLLESWYSVDEFMKKSIAYCTVINDTIVGEIIGTASYNNIVPIDIETEEEHRRKGLAYAMATKFIEDCHNHNYVPQWDCVESNMNSCNMVKKLGFEKIHENTVYWFEL